MKTYTLQLSFWDIEVLLQKNTLPVLGDTLCDVTSILSLSTQRGKITSEADVINGDISVEGLSSVRFKQHFEYSIRELQVRR